MMTDSSAGRRRPLSTYMLLTIMVILTGWALQATGTFMIPVVFSVLLALLVAPVDYWVSKKVPEKVSWLGHVAAMSTIAIILIAFSGLLWIAAEQTISRFPDSSSDTSILPEFGEALISGNDSPPQGDSPQSGDQPTQGAGGPVAGEQVSQAEGIFNQFRQFLGGAGKSLVSRMGDWASGLAAQILGMAGSTLAAIVMIFFLTLIMLIETPTWQKKLEKVLNVSAGERASESTTIIAARMRRYLLARTIIGVITAAMYSAWLWLFGIDLLLVWALLAFLLNFIPTFGSLIAGILPVIYAFVQKDLGTAMGAAAGLLVIEQVMGNFVDPRVQGRQVSLSSLVVLIALLVWSWIWGVAGSILAVPITIAMMIIGAHVPSLRPFALLLSNAKDYEELDRQARA